MSERATFILRLTTNRVLRTEVYLHLMIQHQIMAPKGCHRSGSQLKNQINITKSYYGNQFWLMQRLANINLQFVFHSTAIASKLRIFDV